MRAIDTNVVVRYLTDDDPAQAARAREVVNGGNVFVSLSVLLETEWVLRSGGYGFSADRIARALRDFIRLASVAVEQPQRIDRALAWAEAGLDFADALHLASAERCSKMLSFDRKFVNAATRLADIEVSEP